MPGRLDMTKLLADLMREATPEEASIICNLSLGQLHPPHIGTQFNIATALMASVVADVRQEPLTAITAQAKKMGDLGLLVEMGSWRQQDNLTVKQVYTS